MSDNVNQDTGTQLSQGGDTQSESPSLMDRLAAHVDSSPSEGEEDDEQRPQDTGDGEGDGEPASDAESAEAATEAEGSETAGDELADFEHNGKVHKVPKALIEGQMRQDDYTRKTTEVANSRRVVEAQMQGAQQFAQLVQMQPALAGELHQAQAAMGEWAKVDWQQLRRTATPEQLNQALSEFEVAKIRVNQAQGQWQQHSNAAMNHAAQMQAARVAEGMAVLKRDIGYDDAKARGMTEYAKSHGVGPEQLKGLEANPAMVKILHDAWQFNQAKKALPNAKTLPVGKTIKPGSTPMQRTNSDDRSLRAARDKLRQTGRGEDAIGLLQKFI